MLLPSSHQLVVRGKDGLEQRGGLLKRVDPATVVLRRGSISLQEVLGLVSGDRDGHVVREEAPPVECVEEGGAEEGEHRDRGDDGKAERQDPCEPRRCHIRVLDGGNCGGGHRKCVRPPRDREPANYRLMSNSPHMINHALLLHPSLSLSLQSDDKTPRFLPLVILTFVEASLRTNMEDNTTLALLKTTINYKVNGALYRGYLMNAHGTSKFKP